MSTRRAGFSLLEVVVAMAILSLSLMAIFRLNSGAVAMHAYTKRLTVATLLARSKMTDIEQELYDKGFNVDDQDESGDFSDEGYTSFKWRARIIAPKTEGLSSEQLISAVFGLPGLGSLFGGSGSSPGGSTAASAASTLASSSGGPTAGLLAPGASLAGGMGAMSGMLQGPLTQMTQQLTQAVREIRLSVSWKDGRTPESIDLVTHIVSLAPGDERNGVSASASGTTPGSPTGTTGTTPTMPGTTPNPLGNPNLPIPH
jgi:general secretion pathway protein I